MRLLKNYLVLVCISFLLFFIVRIFIHDEDTSIAVMSGLLFIGLLIYSYFSVRRNIKILKEISNAHNVKQDLVINGIRMSSTVRDNAILKLIVWAFLYLGVSYMAYKAIVIHY